jgi:tRNA threonylcarbamoyladenosine biosynthesis protein TsaE
VRFQTNSPHQTEEVAENLARLCQPGDVILLTGSLGVGKTCFVRGLARGLGCAEKVASPTFVIVREYRGRLTLYHVDLYRIRGEDWFNEGAEDYLAAQGVTAVEWGEKIEHFFQNDYLKIKLDWGEGEDQRLIELVGKGSWRKRLQGWKRD